MNQPIMTFWGKLGKNNTLVTSEGTLHRVFYPDWIPLNNYGFFLVEKRGNSYYVKRFLNETILEEYRKLSNGTQN